MLVRFIICSTLLWSNECSYFMQHLTKASVAMECAQQRQIEPSNLRTDVFKNLDCTLKTIRTTKQKQELKKRDRHV